MIVPAFPGSRTSSRMTMSFGPLPSASGRRMSFTDTGNWRHTAMTPWGVTVLAIESMTCSVQNSTSRSAAAAASASPEYRSRAVGVAKSSTSSSERKARASATACGPSKRKSPVSDRASLLASLATPRTLGERGLSSIVVLLTQAETFGADVSAGRAALAVATSAANVFGSVMARSARMRRSTSTPARFRPWMKRL
jgi:hypothetical protein